MPVFIWRPSSLTGPDKGPLMPNTTSSLLTPRIDAAPAAAANRGVPARSSAVPTNESIPVRRRMMPPSLLKPYRPVATVGLELRPPDLLRALVVAGAKADGRARSQVEAAYPLQRGHERLRRQVRSRPPQRFDQQPPHDEALEAHEVGLFAHGVLRQRRLVLERRACLRAGERHDLRHHHAGGVSGTGRDEPFREHARIHL